MLRESFEIVGDIASSKENTYGVVKVIGAATIALNAVFLSAGLVMGTVVKLENATSPNNEKNEQTISVTAPTAE